MYKPEGISLQIWKFAKSDKQISYQNLRKVFADFSGVSEEHISNNAIYEIVARTVGDAMQQGLVKSHMMYDFATYLCPHPVLAQFYKNDDSLETKVLHAMLNMLRFIQVKDDTTIFVDLT